MEKIPDNPELDLELSLLYAAIARKYLTNEVENGTKNIERD